MSSHQPKILDTTPLAADQAKWLSLLKIDWQDQDGKQRVWEVAARSTRKASGIDAVFVLALLETEPKSVVVVEQFRPPIGKVCIELPAGLVDDKESPQEAAFRELEEETGFKASTVIEETPVIVCDPGMTNANMKLFTLSVPVDNKDPDKVQIPKQNLDEGEHIVMRIVRLDRLESVLKEYDQSGYMVDARLSMLATGYELAKKIA